MKWERRHPFTVDERGIPTNVIEMQMGADHCIDLVGSNARSDQTVEPIGLESTHSFHHALLVIPVAHVDEDGLLRCANNPCMDAHERSARRRFDELSSGLSPDVVDDPRIPRWQQHPRWKGRAVALLVSLNRDLADGQVDG
jgi:hypothetical protein